MLAVVVVHMNILVPHKQHLEVLVVVVLVQPMEVTQQMLLIILVAVVVVENQHQMAD
jgi:hypothetical protein